MPNRAISVTREIVMLRRSLRAVDRSLRRLVPKLQAIGNGRANGKARSLVRRRQLSPKRRAQLKLQGRYIGYVRQLKPKQKAQVRAIRERKGVRAAIARARKLMAA
jgi:hypothetical protein